MENTIQKSISVHEFAKIEGIHYKSAWKIVNRGDIPSYRVGKRSLRILVSDLEAYRKRNRTGGIEEPQRGHRQADEIIQRLFPDQQAAQ